MLSAASAPGAKSLSASYSYMRRRALYFEFGKRSRIHRTPVLASVHDSRPPSRRPWTKTRLHHEASTEKCHDERKQDEGLTRLQSAMLLGASPRPGQCL